MAILKRRRGRKALSTGAMYVQTFLDDSGAECYRLPIVGEPHTYDLALDRVEAGALLTQLAVALAGPSIRDGRLTRPSAEEALRLLAARIKAGKGV